MSGVQVTPGGDYSPRALLAHYNQRTWLSLGALDDDQGDYRSRHGSLSLDFGNTIWELRLVLFRALEWLILIASTSCSFALLFRVAPNLPDHAWRWSTPGTLCALVLWIACTVLAHIYFDHVNDYTRSYGHLNGVVMLLLWLYASNGAILIGGEMNSEIRKAAAARGASPK